MLQYINVNSCHAAYLSRLNNVKLNATFFVQIHSYRSILTFYPVKPYCLCNLSGLDSVWPCLGLVLVLMHSGLGHDLVSVKVVLTTTLSTDLYNVLLSHCLDRTSLQFCVCPLCVPTVQVSRSVAPNSFQFVYCRFERWSVYQS